MAPAQPWDHDPLGWANAHPEYETVVHGRRPRPGERLSQGDRIWMGYTSSVAAAAERQRILGGKRDYFADAGRGARRGTDAGWPSRGGTPGGIDWSTKLASLRPTQRRFEIPYQGAKTLGPPAGSQTMFGKKVWEFVQQQKKMQARLPEGSQSLGSCWRTTVQRMQQGWQAAYGTQLLAGLNPRQLQVFDAIAGTRPGTYPQLWKREVPRKLRYTGVAGALAYLGKATVVDTKAVWEGALEPGAPLQVWPGRPGLLGHSAVFERYVTDKSGRIVALVYSDQWRDYRVLRRPARGDLLAETIYGATFKR